MIKGFGGIQETLVYGVPSGIIYGVPPGITQ